MLALLPKRLAAFVASPFFTGSFTYLMGSVLNSLLPLLATPILTRHLLPEDFGIVGTATALTQILVIFAGMGAYGLFARSYFDDDPVSLRRLVSTGTWFSLAVTAALLGIVWIFGELLGHWKAFPASWLPLVIFITFTTVIQNNYLAITQARAEPFRYIAIQTIGATVNVGLSLFFVVAWQMNWQGRLWALAVAQGLVAAACLYGLIRRLGLLTPSFDSASCRQLMSFGLPLAPHAIGGWIMMMGPRFYLDHFVSVGETGLYTVAFNLTSPLALLLGSANNALMPALYKQLSDKEGCNKMRLCRMFLAVAIALPLFAIACAAGVRLVLPWIVGERFHAASNYIAWMTLTYAVQGIYFIFGNFVVYSRRTSLMTWRADFSGGLVLLIACPLLIRLNGPIGAAQASFVAIAASTLGCVAAARMAYPMPWGAALRSLFPTDTGKKAAT